MLLHLPYNIHILTNYYIAMPEMSTGQRRPVAAEHTDSATFQFSTPVTITCPMQESAPQRHSLPLYSAPTLIAFSL